jgi:hypothetical protein
MNAKGYIEELQEFDKIVSGEFTKVLPFFETRVGTQLPIEISVTLQYSDIFTQRVQHLIDTHEEIMALYLDDAFKKSFLHLQYFQFSILVFDLLEAISVLENQLLPYKYAQKSHQEDALFANKQGITRLALTIENYLLKKVGDTRWVGGSALTIRQARICLQYYTMESERIVLDWYLRNSTGVFSELLHVYQSWQCSNRNQAIEFFDNE